jgi:hypothetical protein
MPGKTAEGNAHTSTSVSSSCLHQHIASHSWIATQSLNGCILTQTHGAAWVLLQLRTHVTNPLPPTLRRPANLLILPNRLFNQQRSEIIGKWLETIAKTTTMNNTTQEPRQIPAHSQHCSKWAVKITRPVGHALCNGTSHSANTIQTMPWSRPDTLRWLQAFVQQDIFTCLHFRQDARQLPPARRARHTMQTPR